MRQTLESLVWSVLLAVGAMLWLAARGVEAPPGVSVGAAQMRPAQGEWQPLDPVTLARWSAPLELRWTLTLARPESALGLRVALRGAGELRCNGQIVLRNGVAAARAADEVPGLIDRWVALPPLAAGEHVVTWQGSSHFVPLQGLRTAEARLQPMTAESMSRARLAPWLVVATAWGGLALTWLYFLRMRPASGTAGPHAAPAYLALVALGAVGVLLPVVESARDLWSYPYSWHLARLRAVLVCTMLAAWLLPLWALLTLHAPRHAARWAVAWGAFVAGAGFSAVALFGHDTAGWMLHFSALLGTGALLWRTRPPHRADHDPAGAEDLPPMAPSLGPLRALVGLALVLMVLRPGDFLDGLYTITLSALMVAAMLRHARDQQHRALQQAALRQALHTQLLRASMQPHGLMNTLAVLQELIEQRPAQASQLVERLADQFSLLRELSQRDLVSLREELELVRTQLDLVGLARSLPVQLAVQGPVDGVRLPPGVLHTLVENALTHGGIKTTAPVFALHIDEDPPGRWRLRLTSPRGAGRPGGSGGSGLGQRFVRESLAGAYGRDWTYAGQPEAPGAWVDALGFPRR